ncbi:MAG: transporter substrate-binding domain-containing protein [Deferribacterota bacterium]|nr:transporter substrate-binding domain-containing protein [Deferribacterota bacterium]
MKILFLFFLIVFLPLNIYPKTINVAVSIDFPPFSFVKNKQLVGFDVDILKELDKKLDDNITFIPLRSNLIIPAISSNLADIGAGGFNITEERKKYVEFSTPYLISGFILISKKSFEKELTLENIGDANIGIYSSDLMVNLANKAKIQNYMIFGSYKELFDSLISGEIEIMFIDYPYAQYIIRQYDNATFKRSESQYFKHDYAFLLNKDFQYKEKFNNVLKKFLKSDIYKKIYLKWFSN